MDRDLVQQGIIKKFFEDLEDLYTDIALQNRQKSYAESLPKILALSRVYNNPSKGIACTYCPGKNSFSIKVCSSNSDVVLASVMISRGEDGWDISVENRTHFNKILKELPRTGFFARKYCIADVKKRGKIVI